MDSGRDPAVSIDDERALFAACGENDVVQHEQLGCYFAAVLEKSVSGRRIQVLLTDTSDYSGMPEYRKPKSRIAGIIGLGDEYFGASGWMSYADEGADGRLSQWTWFKTLTDDAPMPSVRIVASHYSPDNLGPSYRYEAQGGLFNQKGLARAEETIWIYAHTHEFHELTRARSDESRRAPSLNGRGAPRSRVGGYVLGIGSTTDCSCGAGRLQEPSAAVLYVSDGRCTADKVIPTEDCTLVKQKVSELRRSAPGRQPYRDVFPAVSDPPCSGPRLLGLDRAYADEVWKTASRNARNAEDNARRFAEDLVKNGLTPETVDVCLALLASETEETDCPEAQCFSETPVVRRARPAPTQR